jgi:hypothetical protein
MIVYIDILFFGVFRLTSCRSSVHNNTVDEMYMNDGLNE